MARTHTLPNSNQTSLALCLSHTCLVSKLKSYCLTNWLHDLHVIVFVRASRCASCYCQLPTWLHTEVLYTGFFCRVCYTISSPCYIVSSPCYTCSSSLLYLLHCSTLTSIQDLLFPVPRQCRQYLFQSTCGWCRDQHAHRGALGERSHLVRRASLLTNWWSEKLECLRS